MEVLVNDQPQKIANQKTIKDLIHELGYNGGDGIAVAINEKIVPKHEWESKQLNEQDKITLIRATQGG